MPAIASNQKRFRTVRMYAEALFNLATMLAPEPARTSLAELGEAATADVFHGPLMLRGFIAADQLEPRTTSFRVRTLTERPAESPGILLVDSISVEVGGSHSERETHEGKRDVVMVAPQSVLRLSTTKPEETPSL